MIPSLDKIKSRFYKLEGELNRVKKQLQELTDRKHKLMKSEVELSQACDWLNNLAIFAMDNVSNNINSLVNNSIQYLFPNHKFCMEFVQRRNKVECDMYVKHRKYSNKKIDLLEGSGGGLIDIIGFVLRVSFWRMYKTSRNIMCFDEPFRFVDNTIPEDEILELIADKMNLQLLIITHKEKLMDERFNVFKFVQESGKAMLVK